MGNRYLTRNCDCTAETVMGRKRPERCEHGYRFQTAAELNPSRRVPMQRGEQKRKPRKALNQKSAKRQAEEESGERPKQQRRRSGLKQGRGFQASPAQQAKVKGQVCVSCGRDYYEESAEIQAAHVYPRRLAKCECAEGVVPLCSTCHGRYDDQNVVFDLMPALITGGYRAEIVHAFVHHDAPMGEVLRIIGGTEWTPVDLGAAA